MKTISRYIMTLALLITAVGGAWADDTYTVAGSNPAMFGSSWDPTNAANDMTKNGDGTYSITYTNVYLEGNVQYKVVKNHSWDEAYPATDRVISIAEAGTYTVTICFNPTTHEVYEKKPDPEVEVTLNDAKSEASFKMPLYDVTATYTIKRDISVDVTATMGDGTDGVRYRVKKSEQVPGKYEPAEMNMMQVLGLVVVNDDIEQKALTLNQDYYCRIYKLDEQTQKPEGDGVELYDFDFAPGLYAIKAFAKDGSNYAGETALSNTFQLYQGYPVEIAAQSFATYYSDEALTLEESFAETAGLYTISEVNATEAVLSEKIDVMPKRTPMLIYNESADAQTVLLIPTADVAPLTDVAEEFKGTAVEKEVTAEEVAATNFYVLTDQNQFVWVKDAGTIAANKCWLEIAPSEAAGARRIVFSGSGTTGISTTDYTDYTDGTFYDLNGRKFIKKPTKKGIYIQNGKKVVVK